MALRGGSRVRAPDLVDSCAASNNARTPWVLKWAALAAHASCRRRGVPLLDRLADARVTGIVQITGRPADAWYYLPLLSDGTRLFSAPVTM